MHEVFTTVFNFFENEEGDNSSSESVPASAEPSVTEEPEEDYFQAGVVFFHDPQGFDVGNPMQPIEDDHSVAARIQTLSGVDKIHRAL